MSSAQCRLCKSGNLRTLQKEENKGAEYTIVRCLRCDLIQTLEHYDTISPDYVCLDVEQIDANRIWCQGQHKVPAYQQWWKSAVKLMGTIEHGAKVLDIGCGTGGFLKFVANKGLAAFGFDASRAQVEYARKEFPNVRQAISPTKYLKQIGQENLKFDFIVLWDVLEHIRNPLEFLADIRRVLHPCGLLFVSVPNGHAMLWKRRLYRRVMHRHFSFLPWEHVFYYSPLSLACYLNKSGYNVICSSAVVCYPRPLSPFEVIRRMGFSALRLFPNLAPQISAWARLKKARSTRNSHNEA